MTQYIDIFLPKEHLTKFLRENKIKYKTIKAQGVIRIFITRSSPLGSAATLGAAFGSWLKDNKL